MNFNKYPQIILLFLAVENMEFVTTALSDCVTYSNKLRFQKIFSRRKRYVVFPPGSAVVATASVLKAIAPRSPRGINCVLEVDFFYPLQTTIAEWFPKKKAQKKIDSEGTDYEPYSSAERNEYWQYAMHRNRRDIIGHTERVASETTYVDSVPDEYTHAMKVSEDDCTNVYGAQCRYSILGYLLEKSR